MPFSLYPEFTPDDDADESAVAPITVTGSDALVSAALLQSDLADLTAAVTAAASQIVVINVPSPQWAQILARYLQRQLVSVFAYPVVELKKGGNHGLTADLMARLRSGMHLVVVSHDPQTLLPPTLLAAVDASFTLGAPNVRLLRRAIETLTGQPVKNLRMADFTGLDFEALALALRSGSTSQECVRRLRRAAKALKQPKAADRGPRLADLPLSPDIRAWSTNLLAELRRVEAGQLPPGDLTYPLLEGPPGTGKTLIVSALARSAGWRLVSTSVGGWFSGSDGHLGGVSKAATAFFDDVLREPNTIGFIDELDGIPDRAALSEKDRDWWTPIVTGVLLQIDRVRCSGKPIFLVGATNFYDRLDAALTRSGRIELRVPVLPPRSSEELAAIFAHYLQGELDPAVINTAARWTMGKTPADIEAIVRASRSRAMAASRPMSAVDLLDSVVPPDTRSDAETRATAIHEAGHAIVSLSLGLPVETVSIIPSGQSGGFTQGAVASRLPTRLDTEAMAMVMLGGRAADIVLGKGAHAGAEQDLAMATNLIGRAMSEWGLYDHLSRNSSVAGLRRVDERLEPLLQNLLERGLQIVKHNSAAVLALADALLSERVLSRPAVDRIFKAHRGTAKSISSAPSAVTVMEGPLS